MNTEQEKRNQEANEMKASAFIPVDHRAAFSKALDAYVCEPVWARQVKLWRFIALALLILFFLTRL